MNSYGQRAKDASKIRAADQAASAGAIFSRLPRIDLAPQTKYTNRVFELIFLLPLFVVIAGGIAAFQWSEAARSASGVTLIALLAVGAFILPLCMGVWIPDFLFGGVRTLGTAASSDGHKFLVTQQWGSDFYSTQLYITAPDGSVTNPYLDGDDNHSWSVPIVINEASRSVTVTLSGGRDKVYPW